MTANWAKTLAIAAAVVTVALGVNTGVAGAGVARAAARQLPVGAPARIQPINFASTPQEQDPAHCQIHYDAVARFQQTNVAVTCTNKKSTKWFAITWGQVLVNGKWYYSTNPPGFASEDRTLGCGT
jgi:hypothetical protein